MSRNGSSAHPDLYVVEGDTGVRTFTYIPKRTSTGGGITVTNEGPLWPVATSHADAVKMERWLNGAAGASATSGSKVVKREGATLESLFRDANKAGCRNLFVITGWNADGSPRSEMAPVRSTR